MSFKSLLAHRCDIYDIEQSILDGEETYDWVKVASGVHCRVDLQYIRPGRDPQWTPEAGRPTDRTGVGFFKAGTSIRTGSRIAITKGPAGTFLVDGAVDEISSRHGDVHHLEVALQEVPGPRARASGT